VIIKEPKSLYQRFDSRKSMYLRNDEFTRSDENDDAVFYEKERPGPHLDAQALNTAARIIKELIVEEKPVILDLMAGIDSHILPEVKPAKVMGLGLNAAELKKNKDLDDYVVHDLNRNPRLPFDNGSFDVVLNTVSVDYLTKPFEVFKDVGRVLKPGGLFLVLFSNRFFPEKVVNIWRKGSEDERVLLVEELFRKAMRFEGTHVFVSRGLPRPADDKYADLGIPSDPVYAVYAERKGAMGDRKARPVLDVYGEKPRDREALEKKKKRVGETLCCPHCDAKLNKWEVPQHPFTEWDNEYMYICFNDRCSYYMQGWNMAGQGTHGISYRFMYNPKNGASLPIPVTSPGALRSGIMK